MIRIATQDDLGAIVEIYNQAIAAGYQTAFTEPVTVSGRLQWFNEHELGSYPVFVYDDGGVVSGWLSVSPYRAGRQALRSCVEVSYFVDAAMRQKGIGSSLLERAIEDCKVLEYKQMIAIIIGNNTPSMRLMDHFGFEKWGVLPGVYSYNGVICDHLYYGKVL